MKSVLSYIKPKRLRYVYSDHGNARRCVRYSFFYVRQQIDFHAMNTDPELWYERGCFYMAYSSEGMLYDIRSKRLNVLSGEE
jgi:hypothetical protein